MTRAKEAATWRKIGRAFERYAVGKPRSALTHAGLCYAAQRSGLPSYGWRGARVGVPESHGAYTRSCAAHRALTAYLMAEMVLDGRAPSYSGLL